MSRRVIIRSLSSLAVSAAILWAASCLAAETTGFGPLVKYGDPVPRDVREMYDAGVRYLVKTQQPSGAWNDNQSGPGVTGMAMMVLLASGEDPNHGPYRDAIRKAIKSVIDSQNAQTGFLGGGGGHDSMYQHGFAMLALAEAYGAVDDRGLGAARSIGAALELAVRAAVTSAKSNPYGAWRYSPDAKDADTSVSGAVMMGLLAARNAGIEVPDETITRAIQYFVSMTGPNGQVGYSGSPGGGSDAVTSIARRGHRPQERPVGIQAVARLSEGAEPVGGGWRRISGLYAVLSGPGPLSG
jgi:hypothetical protein